MANTSNDITINNNVSINLNEKAVADLAEATQRVEALQEELEGARTACAELSGEVARLAEENANLTKYGDLSAMIEQLDQYKSAAQTAKEELRAFLRVVQLGGEDAEYDSRFSDYFENIASGAMTANQAIAELKLKYESLISGGQISGGIDTQFFEQLSATINKIDGALTQLSTTVSQIASGGVAGSPGAASGLNSIVQALQALQDTGGTSGAAFDSVKGMIDSLKSISDVNAESLSKITSGLRSIADIGSGRYGTGAIKNILTLIHGLQAASAQGVTNIAFNAKGFNDLKIHTTSWQVLANTLPTISNANVAGLQALANINFNNLADLNVDANAIQTITNLISALNSYNNNDSPDGGSGGNGRGGSGRGRGRDRRNQELQDVTQLILRRIKLSKQLALLRQQDGAQADVDYSKTKDSLDRVKAEIAAYSKQTIRAAQATERVKKATEDSRAALQKHKKTSEIAWTKLSGKAGNFIKDNKWASVLNKEYTKAEEELDDLLATNDPENWQAVNDKLAEMQSIINEMPDGWKKLRHVSFDFLKTLATSLKAIVVQRVVQGLKASFNAVVNLDEAITELKIVSQASDAALRSFADTATQSAKKIGASVNAIIQSTTEYSRLGFSLADSAVFAELTTQYSKVADVSVEDATKNITALVKAYNVGSKDLESVIDRLIYVGRNYAISSAEIGEGMNEAASSLVANGNTLDQAIGILTAANTTVQDISRAATAVRTFSARISASKSDLDDLGESVDEVVKIEQNLKAYGIESRKSNGELRSTYDVLGQIADKWGDLDSAQRAAIATLVAGSRQQDIFFSVIQNWQDAQSIVADAAKANGELAEATEQRLDSIQGKWDLLKASFEEFAQNLIDSEFIKGIVDILGIGMKVLNWLSEVFEALGGLRTVLIVVGTVIAEMVIPALITLNTTLATTFAATGGFPGLLLRISILVTTFFRVTLPKLIASLATLKGTIALIGAAIAIITIGVSRYKQAIEDSIQASLEAADSNKENAESLKELAEQYKELSADFDEENGWGDKLDEVRDIQKRINTATEQYGTKIDVIHNKIDGVKTSTSKMLEEITKASKEAANQSLAAAEIALQKTASNATRGFNGWDISTKLFGLPGLFESFMSKYRIDTYTAPTALGGIGTTYIKTNFTDANGNFDFVQFEKQYQAVENAIAVQRDAYLSKSDEYNEKYYNALIAYQNMFKATYDAYISSKKYADSFNDITNPDEDPEKTQTEWDALLANYKKLIDYRKELLSTYKDEIKYRDELAKKEKKVATLQTQLAISQLDTSAAGRAKTRSLAEDLEEAQSELDDFNLEHAIDVLTTELDSQYAEYETYVKGLSDAITHIADDVHTIVSHLDGLEPGQYPITETGHINTSSGGSAGRYPFAEYFFTTHHNGGLVGSSFDPSTEEFAKLLKGEFVATPRMMRNFMNKTLPNIATTSGANEFNAPLVSIECGSVTQESLPELKSIVNEAVSEIKRQFDGGMFRAGYRKSANKIY